MIELETPPPPTRERNTIGSSIEFCPETGAMTFRFFGPRFTGLPPWSLELLALAAGATSVHVDLSAVELADPVRTEEIFRSVLESDHGLTDITFEHRRGPVPTAAAGHRHAP